MMWKTWTMGAALGVVAAGAVAETAAPGQDRNAEETILLGKLKGYVRGYGVSQSYNTEFTEAPKDTGEIVRGLAEIGSTNVVQFFLENISWWHSILSALDAAETGGSRRGSFPLTLAGHALLTMKDVPLNQCVAALIKSRDGTYEAQSLEHITRMIHSKDFLREVERLAETSPDPKRWKDMKERLENHRLRLSFLFDSPFGDGHIKQDALGTDNENRPAAKGDSPQK